MEQDASPSNIFNPTVDKPTANREMPELVDAFDWSLTQLGPAVEWPDSLKAVVRILLTSRFPMWMGWGPDLTRSIQRRLSPDDTGQKAPVGAGQAGTPGLARDLEGDRPSHPAGYGNR